MKVTRLQIVRRGLSNRCPNCGGKTLFKEGTLFQVNPACPAAHKKRGRWSKKSGSGPKSPAG